jgi:hypothetical protein
MVLCCCLWACGDLADHGLGICAARSGFITLMGENVARKRGKMRE